MQFAGHHGIPCAVGRGNEQHIMYGQPGAHYTPLQPVRKLVLFYTFHFKGMARCLSHYFYRRGPASYYMCTKPSEHKDGSPLIFFLIVIKIWMGLPKTNRTARSTSSTKTENVIFDLCVYKINVHIFFLIFSFHFYGFQDRCVSGTTTGAVLPSPPPPSLWYHLSVPKVGWGRLDNSGL